VDPPTRLRRQRIVKISLPGPAFGAQYGSQASDQERDFEAERNRPRDFSLLFPARQGISAIVSPGSVAEILESLRRRADHDITLRLDLEHREAALYEPAWGKAKQPVDPGEPARVEDRLL
jgi:hypothetical protein